MKGESIKSFIMEEFLKGFLDWSWSPIITAISCCYAVYYLWKVVHRPKLFVQSGIFEKKLKKNLEVLNEYYWPTFWGFSSHLQTIFRVVLKSKPYIPYRREFLDTPDQGHLTLDWIDNDDDNNVYPNPQLRPTVVILPGITGSSDASYARHIALESKALGYRCLVFNNRGLGQVELKTPRTFCACDGEDLEFVFKHVKSKFGDSPIFIFAVSLGGIVLTNYLAKVGKPDANVVGVLCVSVAMDSFKSTDSLERPFNWLFYNRHLVNNLKNLVKRNWHVFQEQISSLPYKLEDVMKARTIREFDAHFTSKTFGFDTVEDYYRESSIALKPVENIQVPMLFLNSYDDPFAPGDTLPIDRLTSNPNLAVLLTDYGGHIGFIEGWFVRDRSFVERLFSQLAQMLIQEHKSEDVSRKSEMTR